MSGTSLADFLAEPLLARSEIDLASVLDVFRESDGTPDPLRCGRLLAGGEAEGQSLLTKTLLRCNGILPDAARELAARAVGEVTGWQMELTGAEAVAVLLAAGGVTDVFAYAGTSELALCDAIDHIEGVRLVNGRGDKESAFMAAGASLLEPNRGAAVLHGARGLTNALGAVADARRSEAGTLFIVGLPSSGSARFLPPHGEDGLLDSVSGLVDWHWQADAVPDSPEERRKEAQRFTSRLRDALAFSSRAPYRPALFGIPQDVIEKRWIPITEISGGAVTEAPRGPDRSTLAAAAQQLGESRRPLFLVDDYALRFPGMRQALDRISGALGAPVLQVRYRRGPMLFERLRQDDVANFVGWLNPFSSVHADLLGSCDALVTVEDRNIYPRVVGELPACRKIAVNSDPVKVLKNEYLGEKELLVVGDPAEVLRDAADRIQRAEGDLGRARWFGSEACGEDRVAPERASAEVERGRRWVVEALSGVLARWERPILVDDSQMFGGLIAEDYDELPRELRVFGGHGAFVGSGLPYAAGIAIANETRVMCTLGDQAFTNSCQGLAAVAQQQARVLYVVCNNGESVSLKKQGASSLGDRGRSYLSNVTGLRYHAVAEAFGLPSAQVDVPLGGPVYEVREGIQRLSAALERAAAVDGPSLVELTLPSAPEVWRGIWLTQGLEEQRPSADRRRVPEHVR
jgi:acetolactate synthase-1/2/3 large subunit